VLVTGSKQKMVVNVGAFRQRSRSCLTELTVPSKGDVCCKLQQQ
jgi:hypothetical protein